MRVLVTGGTGMVGSAFNDLDTSHELLLVGTKHYNLSSRKDTYRMFKETRPDAVIHLAARVGGVKGNTDFVADFYSENIRMNTNVLDAAHSFKTPKVLSLLSTCVYPEHANYPLTEDQIHAGPPHDTDFGYAYAKRMLDVQSRALRQQYGCNFICAIPNNIYGENDYFNLEKCHVIPAIIRKIWEAKLDGKQPSFWGDGSPMREFTYSRDIANILLYLIEEYDGNEPLNIGYSNEIAIRDVVTLVASILEYKGTISWDVSKPAGQFRKPSSSKKFHSLSGNSFSYTKLREGLENTCAWFLKNYPNVRGVEE